MNKEEIALLLEEYNQLTPEGFKMETIESPEALEAVKLAIPLLETMKQKAEVLAQIQRHKEITEQALETILKLYDSTRPQYPYDIPWLKSSLGSIHNTFRKMNLWQIKESIIDLNADILQASGRLRPFISHESRNVLSTLVWECDAIDTLDKIEADKKKIMRYSRRIREDMNNPYLAHLSALLFSF